ncbi:MAG: SEL1-like repeat protein, partial [Pyramidobacter sp.]|nr:SEL1-like repeat protein [Pyramidobacter sp.]
MGLLRLDAAERDEDVRSAAAQIARAAEAGYMPAEHALGMMYEQGRMGERDIRSAVMHYRRAANGGNVESMVRLAGIIGRGDYGYSVNKNESI